MSDMFEYLEAQAREDDGPFVNATSVSVDRAERRFASFLSAAKGDKEFNSRMDLVSNDIHKIAADVCEEYGYGDSEHVANIVIGQLQMLAERNSDSSKTDSIGDIKREKLDSQDPSGYYTEPSPKLNPGSAGDNMHNTNPSIPELTPDERQHPDDLSYPNDGALPKANLVDADKPMQPENHVGDSTMTFGEGNQADPVTASKKKSEALDFNNSVELEGYHSVLDQVKQMLYRGASIPQIMQSFGDKLRSWNIDESNLRDVMREQIHQKNLDSAQHWNLMRDMTSSVLNDFGGNSIAISAMENEEDVDPDDVDALIDASIEDTSKSASIKEAAERMDFNSFAEMMTPSEAIEELVGSGMPQHEAKDRIDFYVNHINPGWANKHWTSAAGDMEQPAMRNEMPATDGAGKWRAPQTPQEEAMVNFARQKFERSIDEEVQSQVNAMLQGPDQNRPLEDAETGATYTLADLAESGQLQEILKDNIMKINPDAGVKGIAVDTGGIYSVPITRRTDVNYVQQQITEEEQRRIPGAGGGVTIGDRAIQQRSEGLDPSRGPGPFGGPTGL